VIVFDVKWQKELVTDLNQSKSIDMRYLAQNTYRILAISAPRSVIRVVDVAAHSIYEVTCPGGTGLARWRIKDGKFVGFTSYF
jgi:hypothetical protein